MFIFFINASNLCTLNMYIQEHYNIKIIILQVALVMVSLTYIIHLNTRECVSVETVELTLTFYQGLAHLTRRR